MLGKEKKGKSLKGWRKVCIFAKSKLNYILYYDEQSAFYKGIIHSSNAQGKATQEGMGRTNEQEA